MVTTIAVAAALALSGCGGDGGGDDEGGKASASPTVRADPYRKAPWRLRVVNLLDALRSPEDGRYRTWLPDDPEYWTTSFTYTPRSTADPGWNERDAKGEAVVYPGKMDDAEKTAFFKSLTRDDTVVASTLTVVDPKNSSLTGDSNYEFTFKIRTTDGKWLTGRSYGGSGTADSGRVECLTYDPGQ